MGEICADCDTPTPITLICLPCAEVRTARDGTDWLRILMSEMGLMRASDKKHDKAKVTKHTSWED